MSVVVAAQRCRSITGAGKEADVLVCRRGAKVASSVQLVLL